MPCEPAFASSVSLKCEEPLFDSPRARIAFNPLRAVLCSMGLVVVTWECTRLCFRGAADFLNSSDLLAVTLSAALMLLLLTRGSPLATFGNWLALALVGQFVALQLVNAGSGVRYQHYWFVERTMDTGMWLLLGYLTVQFVLVSIATLRHWRNIRAWLVGTRRPWQLACVGFVFLMTAATVSRQPTIYAAELCFAGLVQLINVANIILAIAAIPDGTCARLAKWCDGLLCGRFNTDDHRALRSDRFTWLAALWITGATTGLSYWVYDRHPHVPDEVVYLFHARYFAEGMLTVPAPFVPEGFDTDLLLRDGDVWYSPVPLGWPAALAIGAYLGIPWLVNPILAGLNVLLVLPLLTRLFDQRTARMAVILLCCSPWYLFMGMNLMTHTFTLTCALVAALALAIHRDTGRLGSACVSGLAVGTVSLIRPLEGLAMAGLLGAWVLIPSGNHQRWRSMALLILGAVMMGGLTLPYNYALTGNPLAFPINVYCDRTYGPGTNSMGFGSDRGLGWTGLDPFPGHGLFDVLINANLNLFATNIELFGWATGSLLLLAVALVSRPWSRGDRLMFATIAAIIGIHSFYWFSGGPDFGARYWYLIIVPCVALTARGMQRLGERLLTPANRTRLIAAVGCLCVMTLVNFMPWRVVDKYHNYRGMRSDIRDLSQKCDFGRSLVLIRGKRHPDYASAAVYNPLDLNADMPIYAWDRSPEIRARLLAAYADRPVWMIDGPTVTGRGFEVVEGPVSAKTLVERNEFPANSQP